VIPADLASRLRIFIDSEVKALLPVEELPADLPELAAGQRFSAKIEAALPDGNFRATVGDRSVTLSMPNGAKAGDVLDLVVTSNNDKTISAKLADTTQPATTAAAQTRLSPAGQLISQLLTGRHSESQPATLNRNEPLLPAPPAKAAALTPVLRQAVSESGLFYESHQAQWVEGETSLESLLREPQGQSSPASQQSSPLSTLLSALPSAVPGLLQDTPLPTSEATQQTAQSAQPEHPQNPAPPAPPAPPASPAASDSNAQLRNSLPQDAGQPDAERRSTGDNSQQTTHAGALKIAEQLMPLVHQQLDTLATHQALWQGQVWPGQTMQWEILDPEGQSHSSSDQADGNEPPPWQSTLRLRMPHLGGIEAQLVITAAGVAVRVSTDTVQAADQLRDGGEALGSALEAAGVPLTGFAVQLGGARNAGT
jgi:hypothetical protein